MGYPNPYSNNGRGNTTPVAPFDFTGSQTAFTPQGYLDSLLDMAKFTRPTLAPLQTQNMEADMLDMGWQPPEFDHMGAMAAAGGPSFAVNPGIFDKIKQVGSDVMGSALPKINPETGKMESLGWAMPTLQGLSSLGNLYLGMKNYGLAKDQLRTQKDQFNMNYNNQRQLLNTQMEDMARARASASSKVESPESYMARNRIK